MTRFFPTILNLVCVAPRFLRFAAHEPRRALLISRMAAAVTALSLGAKFLSVPRLMLLMRPLRRRPKASDPCAVQVETARLLDGLLNRDLFVFEPKCWKRAPVLYRFLALKGVETRVVFGLRRGGNGELEGHAWLEADGSPILEKSDTNYRVTYSFPSDFASGETLGTGSGALKA